MDHSKKTTGPLIIQNLEDFFIELIPCLKKYPKTEKFTLALNTEEILLQAVNNIFLASYIPEKRSLCLKEARLQFQMAVFFLRLARRLHFLSEKDFEKLSSGLIELGKMTTGWIKSFEKSS